MLETVVAIMLTPVRSDRKKLATVSPREVF